MSDYVYLYMYRLTEDKVEDFLKICSGTRRKYEQYGGKAEEVYRCTSGPKDYGVQWLPQLANLREDEQLWIGIVKFRSEQHARDVMEKFDNDEEVNRLYNEFISTVTPLENVSYAEFMKQDY